MNCGMLLRGGLAALPCLLPWSLLSGVVFTAEYGGSVFTSVNARLLGEFARLRPMYAGL